MRNRVIVVGAGAHGRELAALAQAIGWEVAGVTVAADGPEGNPCWPEIPWLGPGAWLSPALADSAYVLALGMPLERRRLAHQLAEAERTSVGLLSDRAVVDPAVRFGSATVVQMGCVLAAGTRLGSHSHIGLGTVVGADCQVGEFVTVGPGVTMSAGVVVGDLAFIGAGSTIAPGCSVGCSSTVSAGAVVVGDVPDGVTARGVPARWVEELATEDTA